MLSQSTLEFFPWLKPGKRLHGVLKCVQIVLPLGAVGSIWARDKYFFSRSTVKQITPSTFLFFIGLFLETNFGRNLEPLCKFLNELPLPYFTESEILPSRVQLPFLNSSSFSTTKDALFERHTNQERRPVFMFELMVGPTWLDACKLAKMNSLSPAAKWIGRLIKPKKRNTCDLRLSWQSRRQSTAGVCLLWQFLKTNKPIRPWRNGKYSSWRDLVHGVTSSGLLNRLSAT